MTENQFQAKLIKKIERRFPGCVVLKNDAAYKQGILDLTVLYEDMWACLEVKASIRGGRQPNQDYYVHTLDQMSFAAIVFPENEEEVLDAMERTFESCRSARVSGA